MGHFFRVPTRLGIDAALGDRGELFVRGPFLGAVLLEDKRKVVAAHLAGPGNECAVTRDFVMLDGLRGSNDRGIQHMLIGDIADDLVPFLDQTVDAMALRAFRLLFPHLEYLLQARYLLLGS